MKKIQLPQTNYRFDELDRIKFDTEHRHDLTGAIDDGALFYVPRYIYLPRSQGGNGIEFGGN